MMASEDSIDKLQVLQSTTRCATAVGRDFFVSIYGSFNCLRTDNFPDGRGKNEAFPGG